LNRLLRIAWLALWPAVFLAGCNSDHAELGRQRFEEKDYATAIEELTWAVEKNPADGASRYLLGRAQAKNALTRSDAKATFRESRKDPEFHRPAAKSLVYLLLLEKNFDDANAEIEQELTASPGDPDWLEARGLVALQRIDAEALALQKDLALVVGEGPSSWVIGRIRDVRTHPDQAHFDREIAVALEHLQNDWGLRDPSRLKAFALRSRKITLQAQQDFAAAIATGPLCFRAMTELGKLAADRDDVDAARKALTPAIAIDENALPDSESRIAYAEHHSRAVDLLSAELEQAKLVPEAIALLASERTKGLLPRSLEERLGRLYFDAGQLAEVAEIVDDIIEKEPRNSWGNYLRGELAAKDGKDEEAITYFNRALVLQRTDAKINAALARACARVGRLAQADEHFGIAIAGSLADDAQVNIDHAQLIRQRSDASQAAQYLESRLKAVFWDAKSKDHQRILAEIQSMYDSLGLKTGTLFEARNAAKINPENPFSKLTVAKLEAAQGLPSIALTKVRQVTDEYPGLAEAWILRAQILVDLGRGPEAFGPLARAEELRPDDPNVRWIKGRLYLSLKNFGEARDALTKALELDPKLEGPRLDLAEVELTSGSFEAAEAHARVLLEKFPDDPRSHRVAGLARVGLKDAKGAIAPLRKATETKPADPWLRIALAEALLETGARAEASTELGALAKDAAAPRAVRVRAAQGLLRGGLFSEAAEAFGALQTGASHEAERIELGRGAFQAKLSAGNVTGALDEIVRMRSEGRGDAADRLLTVAAQRAGQAREAAALADVLRSRDAHDAESLRAAWRAHAELEQWNKALDDLNDLIRNDPASAPELGLERASVLVSLGRVAEAAKMVESLDRQRAEEPKALRVKLEIVAAGSDPSAIETALRARLSRGSGDASDDRLLAAKALARLGKMDLAAPILSAASFRAKTEGDALLAAAILLAARDLSGAAALLDANLDRGPRIPEARGLAALLLDKTPAPEAPFATYLDRVGHRDAAGARDAASRLADPESIRELWTAIARGGSTGPADQAASAAKELAGARLFVQSGLLADLGIALVRGLAERLGQGGNSLEVIRAWWKLEMGEPKPAADIVVPLLEREPRNPAVLLVASIAGMSLAGPDSPTRLMDSPGGPFPDAYLRDLARAAAAAGHHATALQAWSKIQNPTDDDRVLRVLIAAERREPKDALAIGKTISTEALNRPVLAAARLWAGVHSALTKELSTAGIKALVALPHDLERVDLPLLLEAAIAAGLKAEAATILDLGLTKAGFSAEALNRFAEVLRRSRFEPEKLTQLEERIAVLDPSGKLRLLVPRKIVL
jgi:predicted Zn-dependent protease